MIKKKKVEVKTIEDIKKLEYSACAGALPGTKPFYYI